MHYVVNNTVQQCNFISYFSTFTKQHLQKESQMVSSQLTSCLEKHWLHSLSVKSNQHHG